MPSDVAEWSEGNNRTQGHKGHKEGFMGEREEAGFIENFKEFGRV